MKNKIWKKTVFFDTLSYSIGLKKKGIKNADTYAILLAEALSQNIYNKFEVNDMLEKAMKQREREVDRICERIRAETKKNSEDFQKMEKDFREFSHQTILELERIGARTMMTTIGILGSLIVFVGALATFSHAIFH